MPPFIFTFGVGAAPAFLGSVTTSLGKVALLRLILILGLLPPDLWRVSRSTPDQNPGRLIGLY